MDNTTIPNTQNTQIPIEKSVPTGVKIISLLYYIGSVFSVIFGILFLLGSGFMSSISSQIQIGALGTGLFMIFGIILIGLAIFNFFIGRGLWKGDNWARIIAIIFSVIGLFGGLFLLFAKNYFSAIINIVINGLILGYLLFSSSVKTAFIKNQ